MIRKNRLIIAIAAIAMLSGSAIAGTVGFAQAVLLQPEDHWKYKIDRWTWDSERRRTYGLITPQIVVQNETFDRLEGYIADADGTRLEMYDGEQVVQVRFLSNNSVASNWELAGRVHDGYFAIEIPEKYREAEVVRIFIGNHRYVVNDGTITTPQTEVYMNSAMLNYKTNSTLSQTETEVAQIEEPQQPIRSPYAGGSLIDWILSRNGLLPVRSTDAGK
ncbi:MAG: hypothetical protein AB1351_07800 [Thermoproteota archaeon]